MSFIELLKKIRGLHCKFNNGMCRVVEVYWDTGRALIQPDEGVNYTAESRYGEFQLTFVADGYEKIVVDVEELERQN